MYLVWNFTNFGLGRIPGIECSVYCKTVVLLQICSTTCPYNYAEANLDRKIEERFQGCVRNSSSHFSSRNQQTSTSLYANTSRGSRTVVKRPARRFFQIVCKIERGGDNTFCGARPPPPLRRLSACDGGGGGVLRRRLAGLRAAGGRAVPRRSVGWRNRTP